MHPRTMNHLAIAFAGACSLLLACTVQKDTTFPNLPETTQTPPTRHVLDAGLIVLYDDGGEGVEGVGGAGSYTPDAAEVVDVVADAATTDVPGVGATCDLFAPNPCSVTSLGCFPNPSTGNATCQRPGDRGVVLSGSCSPDTQNCGPQLYCGTGICATLCHLDNPQCSAGTVCTQLGVMYNVGYCRN